MKKIIHSLLQYLVKVFTLDLRSLAMARILISILLLIDLFVRSRDLTDLFTDEGVYPAALAQSLGRISIHALSGSVEWQILLFSIAGIAALFLLVGKHTRIATIVSWFLLISLHNRNAYINAGGDLVLRLFLFWGMFLPLGALWSMDSKKRKKPLQTTSVFSAATIVLTLQLIFIYWSTFLLKTGREWQIDNTAVYFALQADYLELPVGRFMLQFPELLKILTFTVLRFEFLAPLLLLIPIYKGALKTIILFLLMSMHLGFTLGLDLLLFSFIVMAYLSALLPSWFWDKVRNQIPKIPISQPLTFPKVPKFPRILYPITLLVMISYVCILNLANIPSIGLKIPKGMRLPAKLLSLDQRWHFFAPSPPRSKFWIVIPGRLQNGKMIDVFSGRNTIIWEKPEYISKTFKSKYWGKYLTFIPTTPSLRPYYGAYLCNSWNKTHSNNEKLLSLQIYTMRQTILLDNKYTKAKKTLLFKQKCQGVTNNL